MKTNQSQSQSEQKITPLNSQARKIDWTKVLEVVLKILSIGLYHVEKHSKPKAGNGSAA